MFMMTFSLMRGKDLLAIAVIAALCGTGRQGLAMSLAGGAEVSGVT
jgi:hypothetical protein